MPPTSPLYITVTESDLGWDLPCRQDDMDEANAKYIDTVHYVTDQPSHFLNAEI